TGGAGTQHFPRGGFIVAYFSASTSERGRWMTQIWPCESTVMPPICPMIQLFGSCFGQDASTANVGTSPAETAPGRRLNAAAARQMTAVVVKRVIARAQCVSVMKSSQDFLAAL